MPTLCRRLRARLLVHRAKRAWPDSLNTAADVATMRHAAAGISRASMLLRDNDPLKPLVLSNLGAALFDLAAAEPGQLHLRVAVSLHLRAVELIDSSSAHASVVRSNLLVALVELYEKTGSEDRLALAIDVGRDVCSDLRRPVSTRDLPTLQALAALEPHQHLGVAGLTSLVNDYRLAVDDDVRTPTDVAHRCNIASLLVARFRLTGDVENMVDAVETYRAALSSAERHGFAIAEVESGLATALAIRYEYGGHQLEDIAESAALHERSLTREYATPLEYLGRVNVAATAYARLSRRSGRHGRTDLDRAIDVLRSCPVKDLRTVCNLAAALLERAGRFDTDDAELTIELLQTYLAPADPQPFPSTAHEQVLAKALLSVARFEVAATESQVAEAEESMRAAISALDDDDPDRAYLLNELGDGLLDPDGSAPRNRRALEAYQEATEQQAGLSAMRGRALAMAAHAAGLIGDWPCASSSYQNALTVEVGAPLAWRPPRDNHYGIEDLGTLVVDAIAAALHADELATALTSAERGRTLILNTATGYGWFDILRQQSPDLAARVTALRNELLELDWNSNDEELLRSSAARTSRGDTW